MRRGICLFFAVLVLMSCQASNHNNAEKLFVIDINMDNLSDGHLTLTYIGTSELTIFQIVNGITYAIFDEEGNSYSIRMWPIEENSIKFSKGDMLTYSNDFDELHSLSRGDYTLMAFFRFTIEPINYLDDDWKLVQQTYDFTVQ